MVSFSSGQVWGLALLEHFLMGDWLLVYQNSDIGLINLMFAAHESRAKPDLVSLLNMASEMIHILQVHILLLADWMRTKNRLFRVKVL